MSVKQASCDVIICYTTMFLIVVINPWNIFYKAWKLYKFDFLLKSSYVYVIICSFFTD